MRHVTSLTQFTIYRIALERFKTTLVILITDTFQSAVLSTIKGPEWVFYNVLEQNK